MRETRRVEYGTHAIEFSVERRERRTMEIAVEPDASVVVAAPIEAEAEKIDAKVRKRAAWILRQQRYFEAFLPRTPERRFVAGETHLYLGRQYRLRVIEGGDQVVKATRGFLVVELPDEHGPKDIRRLVEQWYKTRAHLKFAERVEINAGRFPAPEVYRPCGLVVRPLARRWGSMSPAGRLMLNQRLIEAPMHCIDYVITHELCHRTEPHHGPRFFELLASVMPDWPKRKDRLERCLA